MKNYPWVRLWHDMPTDPKWRTIARRARQTIPNVMSVYLHMMINASNATERGTLENWNDEDVASALDLETEDVAAIREAMQGRVLEGNRLTGWEKRQPAREDGSAERAKAWREARKGTGDAAGRGQNGPKDDPNVPTADPNGSNDASATPNEPTDAERTQTHANAIEQQNKNKKREEEDKEEEQEQTLKPGDGEKPAAPGDAEPVPASNDNGNTGNSAATAFSVPTQTSLLDPSDDGAKGASRQPKAPSRAKAEPKPRPSLVKVELPDYLDAKLFENYLVVRVRGKRPIDETSQAALLIQIAELHSQFDVNKLLTMATLGNWGNIYGDKTALLHQPVATGVRSAPPPVTFDQHGFGATGQAAMAAGIEFARRMGLPIPGQANDPNTIDA